MASGPLRGPATPTLLSQGRPTTRSTAVAASTSVDSQLRLWDIENQGVCLKTINAGPAEAWAVKFSPDGQYLAAGSHKGDLNIWGVESGAKELTLQTRKKFLLCTAYVRIDRCLEKLG
ncbi:hypothetical protein BC938DRAFT_475981 [Jimgerdemannia flammicorona]|uniref:Uncharacterized protein n=1 Tax=Jimgerdemannia flammicorona TaxID=994334 RepID=A0A433QR41_9FUNG|nr:hypothetical protein BC938DRAFT_475981 [Jimgerdemannia flammicorona]